jgi:hypothetical protein
MCHILYRWILAAYRLYLLKCITCNNLRIAPLLWRKQSMTRSRIHVALIIAAILLAAVFIFQQPIFHVISAQDDADQAWLRSDTPAQGFSSRQLSPPDWPNAHVGPETPELAPTVPEGIFLRDFRLPGSALRPRASGVGYYWGAGGGCIYNSGGNADEYFNAPLTLPQGAMINTLRMYYNDTSEASNTIGWLTVYDLEGYIANDPITGQTLEWAVASAGSNGFGFADAPNIGHRVDYSTYSYALNWRPVVQGASMQLCGFRIYYESPPFSFLPIVTG